MSFSCVHHCPPKTVSKRFKNVDILPCWKHGKKIDTLERQQFEDYSQADLHEVMFINLPRDRKSTYLSLQLYNTSKTQWKGEMQYTAELCKVHM